MPNAAISPLLFLLLLLPCSARSPSGRQSHSYLISDGIRGVDRPSSFLQLGRSFSSSDSCDQTYGFMPCSTTVLGNLFLMAVYGYLMLLAATYLSAGCEILLNVVGPGVIGGLVLPVLGALPDALLILVSGISGSKETAQNQVSIGMGLLAGSTVMLLTLLWGTCVVVGQCDLPESSHSIDEEYRNCCTLTRSGVTTDSSPRYAAVVMAISVIPFIIVQLQTVLVASSAKRITILISLVISIVFLIAYCLYQTCETKIRERREVSARLKLVMSGIIRHVHRDALGRLLNNKREPHKPAIEKIFHRIDEDCNGYISISELKTLILGLEFLGIDLDRDDATKMVMKELDESCDNKISKDEFMKGFSKWLLVAKDVVPNPSPFSRKFVFDFLKITTEEYDALTAQRDDAGHVNNVHLIWFKAISLLLLGTVIAAVFADPLVDAVDNFSSVTSIPSFFISFIAMPLASNSSEAVSAIIFASKKKQTTASLTFSEIYGSATMNNTLCLAVFLALVYFRDLTWDFSAEVLVILIVCIVMGLFASFRTTYLLWTCIPVFLMYPLSLALVYILDYCLGWS